MSKLSMGGFSRTWQLVRVGGVFSTSRIPCCFNLLAGSLLFFGGCINPGVAPMPTAFGLGKPDLDALAEFNDSAKYDGTNGRKLFEAGIAISDESLEKFFGSFDTLQRNITHHQNLFNIVTGATIGASGLTGASSKTLGLIGIGQATVNSEFQNYIGIYLLSPTLDVVRKKLGETRRTYATNLRAKLDEVTTYSQVRAMIVEYHATGSLLAIRGYIQSAANVAKFAVVDGDALQTQVAAGIELLALQAALKYAEGSTEKFKMMDKDIAFALYLKAVSPKLFEDAKTSATKGESKITPDFGLLAKILTEKEITNALVEMSAYAPLSRLAELLDFQAKAAALTKVLAGTPAQPPAEDKTMSIQIF